MPVLTAKFSEILLKTTNSKDLDDALNKLFTEYIELKLKDINEKIEVFKNKWGMSFNEFKKHIKEGTLPKNSYSYDVEKDFWEWEELETLKEHYEDIKNRWI